MGSTEKTMLGYAGFGAVVVLVGSGLILLTEMHWLVGVTIVVGGSGMTVSGLVDYAEWRRLARPDEEEVTMPTQDETAQAISESKRRDELLRQIGEKVVEQTDKNGYRLSDMVCPVCGAMPPIRHEHTGHASDCPLTRYLEAKNG